jgi:hypothetical protein
MNLRAMSDSQLLQKAESLAQRERELLTEILHHLREIESRRLFSAVGCASLFDYCIRKLGYSADQAARRIAAMRLLKELPEIEKKIEEGSLNLTNLGMAQRLFSAEKTSKPEKLEILQKLENKSTREAEKILVERSSEPTKLRPDRVRSVTTNKVEISFVADESLAAKLDRVKGLLAHTESAASMAKLISKVCDIAIERLSPTEKKTKAAGAIAKKSNGLGGPESQIASGPRDRALEPKAGPLGAPLGHCGDDGRARRRNYIPENVRREIWNKAGNKCQNCRSTNALQIDHIRPVFLGGHDLEENLRLLCRTCNQRAAVEKLGLNKMRRYWDPAR